MTTASLERPRPRDLRREHAGLRALWQASACSLTGSEAYDATLLLLTTSAYGSVLAVGPLGLALRIGPLLLAPAAAVLLDRRPGRKARLARSTTLFRAVLVLGFAAAVPLGGSVSLALYGIIVAIETLDTVFLAGVRATIPRLLADDTGGRRRVANSMLTSQWSAIQIVVPSLTIALVGIVRPSLVFITDAVTFTLAFFLLGRYVRDVEATYDESPPEATDTTKPSYLESLRDGFIGAWRDPITRAGLVLAAVGQGIMFTLLLALPVIAQADGFPKWTVGVGLSTLAVGALVGARLAAKLTVAEGRILVLDPLVRILGLLGFAVGGHVAIILAACLVTGVAVGVSSVARLTLIQGRFGEGALGRVMTLAGVSTQALMPVLPWVWDGTRHTVGPHLAFLILAGVLLATAVVAMVTSPLRPWRQPL